MPIPVDTTVFRRMGSKLRYGVEGCICVFAYFLRISTAHTTQMLRKIGPVLGYGALRLNVLGLLDQENLAYQALEVRPRDHAIMQHPKVFAEAGVELRQPLVSNLELDGLTDVLSQVHELETDNRLREYHPVLADLAKEADIEG